MAAAQTLGRVNAALTSAEVHNALSNTFGDSSVLDAAAAKKQAKQAVLLAKELLGAQHGISIACLRDSEVAAFVRDASTTDHGSFSASEYQVLVETTIKYAALKARQHTGRRWGLGLGLSAMGAVALSAAVFTSAGLLLVAAPTGAAIGAVAVAADGLKTTRRNRRTAKNGSSSSISPAAAAPAGPEDEAPTVAAAPEDEAEIQAAPESHDLTQTPEATPEAAPEEAATEATADAAVAVADAPVAAAAVQPVQTSAAASPAVEPAASGESSPRGSSEELVGAVVEVLPPTAADAPKEPVATAAPAADATRLLGAAATEAVAADADALPLPELVKSASPEHAESLPDVAARSPVPQVSPFAAADLSSSVDLDAVGAGGGSMQQTAQLPPLPLKKSGSIKKAYKGVKRALGIPSKKDKLANGADSAGYPPTPKRSSFSFTRRNSFSSDISEDTVEPSKGSFKKFMSMRRSHDGSGLPSFIRRSTELFRKSQELPPRPSGELPPAPRIAAAY